MSKYLVESREKKIRVQLPVSTLSASPSVKLNCCARLVNEKSPLVSKLWRLALFAAACETSNKLLKLISW